jgi:hypothetical protein
MVPIIKLNTLCIIDKLATDTAFLHTKTFIHNIIHSILKVILLYLGSKTLILCSHVYLCSKSKLKFIKMKKKT